MRGRISRAVGLTVYCTVLNVRNNRMLWSACINSVNLRINLLHSDFFDLMAVVIRRAIVSVFDKTGLEALVKELASHNVAILSTGMMPFCVE